MSEHHLALSLRDAGPHKSHLGQFQLITAVARMLHRTGAGGLPKNAATKATYRAINIIALWIAGNAAGYTEPRWATYRQWAATGAQVRKGEKGTMVVFFKELSDDADGEKAGEGRRCVARARLVFNVAQVDGAEVQDLPAVSFDPIAEAERLGAGLRVPTEHGGDQACYLPSRDLVRMPQREQFHTRDGYYATLFHELGHATGGAKHRLDRDLSGRFGDQAYAMEELVAEITSAFVRQRAPCHPARRSSRRHGGRL